jgi:hypothetical protein
MNPRKDIRFSVMFAITVSAFLIAGILLESYHNLMIKKYGHAPFNKLPKVEGTVVEVSQACLAGRGGLYRPIKIKKHTGDFFRFGIECSQRTGDVEIFKDKPISIYYEKWLFPTFKKESAVAAFINDVDFFNASPPIRIIQKIPMKLTAWDYFNVFKWAVLFITILIFPVVLLQRFYVRKAVNNYKKIRLFKSQAKAQFRKSTQDFMVKIIFEDLKFTTDDKYLGAVLYLNIYYMKNDGTFWHYFFNSDGSINRTTQIPKNIVKLKWPNLMLTE